MFNVFLWYSHFMKVLWDFHIIYVHYVCIMLYSLRGKQRPQVLIRFYLDMPLLLHRLSLLLLYMLVGFGYFWRLFPTRIHTLHINMLRKSFIHPLYLTKLFSIPAYSKRHFLKIWKKNKKEGRKSYHFVIFEQNTWVK